MFSPSPKGGGSLKAASQTRGINKSPGVDYESSDPDHYCRALMRELVERGDAAELIALRYGQNASSAGSLSSLPLTVAERKGFFIREGLKLDVVPIPGGTDRIVVALDKGEIDAGKNATPYLIQAVSRAPIRWRSSPKPPTRFTA